MKKLKTNSKHIGDVYPNILISYMHFSELVWIHYEVFKVTVKQSKGKNIRRANELGQKRGFFEFRGKTHGCDTTRGSNVIVPFYMVVWWHWPILLHVLICVPFVLALCKHMVSFLSCGLLSSTLRWILASQFP